MTVHHHLRVADAPRNAAQVRRLTHESSMRERVFEHMLLGQIGLELLGRGVEFEVLHGETDRDGYDLVIDAGGVMRHIQLKVKIAGGARGEVTVNMKLAGKPAGCVIWLTFDADAQEFNEIRWFGGRPGQPLPDAGEKLARHTRANSDGIKAYRPAHRIIAATRFERLEDIAQLTDRLFGAVPADPPDLLRSRFERDAGPGPAWFDALAAGDLTAIPKELIWDDAAPLTGLIDGYRLLALISAMAPDEFLTRQRARINATGRWEGDAVTLWVTLFLEGRAEHFGDDAPRPGRDLLCRQLASALATLDKANA